jgi:hypothetical protein
MTHRYVNINKARVELIDLLEKFGKVGVLWYRPILTDEDHRILLKEVRDSGWQVRVGVGRKSGEGDRFFPTWDIGPAGNWRNRLKSRAELPAPGELNNPDIPNPDQAEAVCKVRNAAFLSEKRSALRSALLALGGIRLQAEEQIFFPPVLRADLHRELNYAGWEARRSYKFDENRVGTVVMELHPSHKGEEGIDAAYVAMPLAERLPTPQECTRHALVLRVSTLRQVRRQLSAILAERKKSGAQRFELSTRDWSAVVEHWVATKLRDAGWTVNGEGRSYRYKDRALEIKPAVHRHIRAAAVGKYFPMPEYAPDDRAAAVLAAARSQLARMLPKGSGRAVLPDGLFEDEVRDKLIAELTEKRWRCVRDGAAYAIETPVC